MDYNKDYTGGFDTNDIEQNKLLAAVGYIPVLFLIPMFLTGGSPFAKFHANQGLILTIFSLVCAIVTRLVGVIIGWIPVVGGIISGLVYGVLAIATLGLMLYGIVCSVQGRAKKLPFIGDIIDLIK